jgi:hypothetical protein
MKCKTVKERKAWRRERERNARKRKQGRGMKRENEI